MHHHHIGLTWAFFALALLMPGSTANELPLNGRSDKDTTKDSWFLARAVGCETAEVRFADLALEKSRHSGVRNLARKIRDAHTRLRDSLVKTAKSSKAPVNDNIDKKDQDELARMKKLTGAEFDRAYVRHMIDAQEKEAILYAKWSKDARDESLRKIAREALAIIKEHRPEAQRLQKLLAS